MNEKEKNKVNKSTLYLVGTPIGNLADMSERAKKVLSEVDFIAAEDTRNSLKLLTAYGIHAELVSYHEHNKHESGERIVARLLSGESCALITDAGMPAISDPGEDLVRLCSDTGITVSVVPGPSAVVSALALSALSTKRFAFEGFLPAKQSERKKRLSALVSEERTMIFYEAPHKLRATLSDMLEAFGENRKISLCRELTKLNEEAIRTTLAEAVCIYAEKEPKGEYVLVIEGCEESGVAAKSDTEADALSPKEQVEALIASGVDKKTAIKEVAKKLGVHKSEIYGLMI